MLTKLTDAQMALMPEIRDKWIKLAHSGKYDPLAIEDGITFVYSLFNRQKPRVVHCLSPIGARITIAILKRIERAGVWAGVWDGVGDGVWAGVWAGVGAGVGAGVRAELKHFNPDYYCNFGDYHWTAVYEYFQSIGIDIDWSNFSKWTAFLSGNPFETYSFENMCFVVKPPTTIIKNEAGRLHNPQGPAVVFPDGYSLYFINGRNMPAWIWEQRDKITKDQFLKERNAEIRGAMYAVLGQKRVFDLIGADEVCRRSANNETYILYRTKERIGEKHWQWVGVTCPSTATQYLLGVPDTVTCPIEGVAGTWGLTATEYIINQHT